MKTLLFLFILAAANATAQVTHTLTDETGRSVTLPTHPHRIVSLVPSITDDIYALGAAPDIVAISDYTQFPAEARSKPSIGGIIDPSLEKILDFHPDLVLAMTHANNQATLDKLTSLHIPVYVVDPHGVAGILHSIDSLGHATGREPQAQALTAQLKARIAKVQAAVQGKPVVNVFMPVSYEPPITIGKGAFITEIIALAGGRSITDDLAQEWPHVSMEAVVERAPQALLMMRGGHMTLATLKDRPGWSTLPAVRAGRVYLVDKRIDFPSPIAIDALEDLARQFHP